MGHHERILIHPFLYLLRSYSNPLHWSALIFSVDLLFHIFRVILWLTAQSYFHSPKMPDHQGVLGSTLKFSYLDSCRRLPGCSLACSEPLSLCFRLTFDLGFLLVLEWGNVSIFRVTTTRQLGAHVRMGIRPQDPWSWRKSPMDVRLLVVGLQSQKYDHNCSKYFGKTKVFLLEKGT